MTNKTINILLLICIICFVLSWFLYWNITFPNEQKIKPKLHDINYTYATYEHMYKPKFDYFNGLWLAPMGLFFTCVLIILGFPSYEDIYKRLKKDFIKKIREGKTL